jgi:acetyl esterase/lipase
MRLLKTAAFAIVLVSSTSTRVTWAGPLQDWLAQHRGETTVNRDRESREISLPDGASLLRSLAYGNDLRQTIDVYLPANAHDAPVVFMVHGGAWRIGDKSAAGVVQNKISRWLPKGFIFVSVDYPMLPQQDALGQADDVARALAYAQSQATSWGGDPDKFIVMGHSAGAHLVTLLAAAPASAYRLGAKPWLGTVSLDSAALDVVQIMDNRHLPFYDAAFGSDRARWRLASPIDALTRDAKPILTVCSLPRRDHSCDHAADFVAKANALGVRSRMSPQNLSHEQINAELGLPGSYTDDVEAFMASLDPKISALLGRP